MLSKCANQQCGKPFLRLREGKLFAVETDRSSKSQKPPFMPGSKKAPRHVEHFWLCGDCAAQWTLAYDPAQGISLVPLHRPVAPPVALPAARAVGSGVA
jgi:alkylhydroperoxidase family enzyme